MSNQIFVISGPSGVGKSTVIKLVRESMAGLGYSISHTSREPRGEEADGIHYHFVTKEAFRTLVEEGAFVEWAEVYDDLYGTSYVSLKGQLDRKQDVIMDLDSEGAGNIRKHFPESVLIYIVPPSIEELERRLRNRATDGAGVIEERLKRALKELESCVRFDYLVFNEDLDRSVEAVESIITSERCRLSNQLPAADKLFNITTR